MKVNEAKEILESVGYIVESFEDDLRNAFITQCGEMVIGNEPIWRKYYNRIMKNQDMVQYISDARNDGLDADEIVEYLLDWDEQLNEDFITEKYSVSEIKKYTVYEEEYDTYTGKIDGFWWSFSNSISMSKTDRGGKSRQFKVYAGKIGEPKTRKCLATKANYTTTFEIIADYLNQLNNLNEDFTMGVRSTIGCRSRHTTFNGWLCSSNDEVG